MLGIIAKLSIKPGTNADFEAAMKALQAKVGLMATALCSGSETVRERRAFISPRVRQRATVHAETASPTSN